MRWRALIGTAILVAALGAGGLLLFGRGGASTPLARIGLALQDDGASASLRADVEAVRAGLKPEDLGVFDLVVALRGLESAAHTDWGRAEALCRGLRWPRCDRPALDEMKRRSRPSDADRNDLDAALPLAMANATWAFGSEDAARKMFRRELDRIPESDGPAPGARLPPLRHHRDQPRRAGGAVRAGLRGRRAPERPFEGGGAGGGPGAVRPARQRVAALLRQRRAPADLGSVRAQPAEVIFVTSPGLVIPGLALVPSN